jgi:pimeloyl-ACP methyl ester carboxylesterase
MKRILTFSKWFILWLALLFALLVAVSYAHHRWQTAREEADHLPPGQMVAVNGHSLHVYAEGERGDLTLVFMSGSGTTAPVLDFKGLYSRLSGDYRIVVVERAGYGWSDDSGGISRDIETVMQETRLALQGAGESPPYILLPHSMSGLEAIHWANRYPDEVVAIVGLDPASPPIYEILPPPRLSLTLVAFTARTGLLRLMPFICHESPSANYLTDDEVAVYCSIMYRRTLSADMLAEIETTQENARLVAANGYPTIPFYFFISNGEGLPMDNWGEVLSAYAKAGGGEYMELDVGHYVHSEAAELIAAETRAFIERIR